MLCDPCRSRYLTVCPVQTQQENGIVIKCSGVWKAAKGGEVLRKEPLQVWIEAYRVWSFTVKFNRCRKPWPQNRCWLWFSIEVGVTTCSTTCGRTLGVWILPGPLEKRRSRSLKARGSFFSFFLSDLRNHQCQERVTLDVTVVNVCWEGQWTIFRLVLSWGRRIWRRLLWVIILGDVGGAMTLSPCGS